MAAVALEIDPTSEDAANVSLVLTASPFKLRKMELPPPPVDSVKTSGVDVEGTPAISSKPQNRFVTLGILATSTTDSALQTSITQLQQKLGKLYREGGTLKITTPAATAVVANVIANGAHAFTPTFEHPQYDVLHMLEFELVLECTPYLRGAAVQLADHAETTLPALVFTDTAVGGDVEALCSLLVDNDSANNWSQLLWGIETDARYTHTASSGTGALFYEAESRTVLGGAATAAGPSGASGGGNNVVRHTSLLNDYQGLLSTQASGAGAHLTHVGNFRMFARVYAATANSGIVNLALEWSVGDFQNVSRNAVVTLESSARGQWRLIDLGLVSLEKSPVGTHRWEGRIVGNSTVVGDDVDIDYLVLQPIDYGSGIVTALPSAVTSSTFDARDDFTGTTDGNALNARTAPAGGSWATSGDTTDFVFSDTVNTVPQESLRRSTSVAGSTGRFAIVGTTNFANVRVECDIGSFTQPDLDFEEIRLGVIARWTDSSNHFIGYLSKLRSGAGCVYELGVRQVIAAAVISTGVALTGVPTYATLRLIVLANGNVTLLLLDSTKTSTIGSMTWWSAQLATGGTLATGKPGIWDYSSTTSLKARYYDNFLVSSSPEDAAVFNGQSLQIADSYIRRENSTGAIWGPVGSYEGDFARIPPAGRESRTLRGLVKPVATSIADASIDDVSARLTVTPRYLVLPA